MLGGLALSPRWWDERPPDVYRVNAGGTTVEGEQEIRDGQAGECTSASARAIDSPSTVPRGVVILSA